MGDFFEQYKRPEWQRKRLEVMSLADFACEGCGCTDKTLNVHHKFYIKSRMPWEYEDDQLRCLCVDCHKRFHEMKQELLSLLDTGGCDTELILGFAKAASHLADELPLPIDSHEQACGAAMYLGWGYRGAEDLIDIAIESSRPVDPRLIEFLTDSKLYGLRVARYVFAWNLIKRGFNPHDAQELFSADNMTALWRGETVSLSNGRFFTKAELESPLTING